MCSMTWLWEIDWEKGVKKGQMCTVKLRKGHAYSDALGQTVKQPCLLCLLSIAQGGGVTGLCRKSL